MPEKGVFTCEPYGGPFWQVSEVSMKFRLSIQTTDLPMATLDLPKASLFVYKNIIRLDGIYFTVDSIEVSRDIRCMEAEVQILRTYRAYDGTQFAVTIDESSMRRSRLNGVSILRSPNESLLLLVP
jgi:hypothetical protein